jgi:hypothetical protein
MQKYNLPVTDIFAYKWSITSFAYLGNMINNGNRNDNCVKERIQAGNRTYFTNLSTLKSKIILRAAKIQVYKILIRPVATYGV